MEIVTRKQAIVNGDKTYFTGKQCPHGHVATRWVSTMGCIECTASKAIDWRADNSEHRRTYRNQYRVENPDIERKHRRKYQKRANELRRQKHERDPIRFMIYAARSRAKKQGLPFDLRPQDLSLPETCPVLGVPLERSKTHQQDNSPTLDRIIPDRGYVQGNVIVVCAKANRIKNDATVEEVQRVADFYRTLIPECNSDPST